MGFGASVYVSDDYKRHLTFIDALSAELKLTFSFTKQVVFRLAAVKLNKFSKSISGFFLQPIEKQPQNFFFSTALKHKICGSCVSDIKSDESGLKKRL